MKVGDFLDLVRHEVASFAIERILGGAGAEDPSFGERLDQPTQFYLLWRWGYGEWDVPYGEAVNSAPQMAREQAEAIAANIVSQGGPDGLWDKEIVAMVAYLQRLGKDIKAVSVSETNASDAREEN